MISRPATATSRGRAKGRPSSAFVGELRKRGLVGTLAAFIGSGWLVYEVVHFILVDHYGLPEKLKDIAIISVLGASLCALTWRWFRGGKKARKPKWEYILVPVVLAVTVAADIRVLAGRLSDHQDDPYAAALDKKAWKNSIAVLPFIDLSAEKDQDYFCDGLTEEMITRLSQIRGLKVTARTSAFAFKGEERDVREIGRRLGVEKILEGSVRKDASRLRVSAQLINVADGFHLWSQSYDRDLDRVISIQDDIARSVAGELKLTLREAQDLLSGTSSLDAYNEFLLGQHYYAVPTKKNLETAIDHYERAIELNPEYARAWAGLGAALGFLTSVGFVPVEGNYPKALAAIETALALDETLAFGHAVKGWMQMTFDWDWAGAEASFSRALRIEPARGFFGAAQLALALGRFDKAVALAERAADLDSLSSSAQMNLALTCFYAGRLEQARDGFLKVLSLSPGRGNVHALLGQVYLALSRPESALAEAAKEKDDFFRLPTQAMAHYALGNENEAYEALGELIDRYSEGGAYQVAQVYAFIGEAAQAFEWLEIALKQRDGGLYLTKADPFFRSLRSEPRFTAFLGKVGLPADTVRAGGLAGAMRTVSASGTRSSGRPRGPSPSPSK